MNELLTKIITETATQDDFFRVSPYFTTMVNTIETTENTKLLDSFGIISLRTLLKLTIIRGETFVEGTTIYTLTSGAGKNNYTVTR